MDYTLTAAVSLMAGTKALASLLPDLLRHEVAFALPTYAFVVMVALLALAGFGNLLLEHGVRPDPPPPLAALEPLGLFLVLAANTAFADFPRLAAMLAEDRFLPRQLGWIGDRLVFQNGIGVLVMGTALFILLCRGDTTMAVNLYALGVFLAFTLSQAGMVVRWWRRRGGGWLGRLLMNALGALTTLLVLVVIAIPLIVAVLARIRRRYRRVDAAIAPTEADRGPIRIPERSEPIGNDSIVWVRAERDDPVRIRAQWKQWVGEDPRLDLVILDSPYASLIQPFVNFVAACEVLHPDRSHTIVMPVAIPRYPLDGLLLNQRGINLRQALLAERNRVFTLVRFFLPA